MLERIKVSRFKSLKDVSLEFGRVNLFIGGNGTGKSNVLEAIGLASACFGRSLGDSDIASKGLRLTPPTLMKSSFKNEHLPKTLKLEVTFSNGIEYRAALQSRDDDPLLRFFSETAEHQKEKIFGRSNRGVSAVGFPHADRLEKHRGLWDQIKVTHDVSDQVADTFAEFSRYVVYSPQTDFLRARQSGRVEVPPVGLHGEGLSDAVSSFLKELGRVTRQKRNKSQKLSEAERREGEIVSNCANLAFLPKWAKSFGVRNADSLFTSRDIANRSGKIVYFTDEFMHESRNRLSVYDSSEGTLFLLFAAIILAHPEAPRIFALDNVDNALNPKLTRKLVEQIIKVTYLSKEKDVKLGARQVFLTSHNPTALDAFDLFDNDQRVFIVRRNDKGHTVIDRLQPPPGQTREDWRIASNGRNLSQLWLDGAIPGALGAGEEL